VRIVAGWRDEWEFGGEDVFALDSRGRLWKQDRSRTAMTRAWEQVGPSLSTSRRERRRGRLVRIGRWITHWLYWKWRFDRIQAAKRKAEALS